jgi:hypothetical protein
MSPPIKAATDNGKSTPGLGKCTKARAIEEGAEVMSAKASDHVVARENTVHFAEIVGPETHIAMSHSNASAEKITLYSLTGRLRSGDPESCSFTMVSV